MGALAVIATPRGVAAQTRMASLVRGVGAGSDKAAGYVSHFLRAKFQADPRYTAVDLAETLGSPDAEKAKKAFETADSLMQKGRGAFESLDLDTAVENINNALSKYERHAASVTDFKKVAEGLMLLGAAHILRGEERTGAKRLAQAIALHPEIEPDPRLFNPGMRKVFDQAGKTLAGRPTGDLSLSSNPSYAEIYVDGRFVGVTPMLVPGVTEGGHYVRLVKDSYRDWGKMLNVKGGGETNETATLKSTTSFADFEGLLEEALAGLADDSGSDSLTDAADQLGIMLNIDHLFLCEVRLDGELVKMRANLYDLNRQKLLYRAEQGFPYSSETADYEKEVSAFFDREFAVKVESPEAAKPEPRPEETGGLGHAVGPMCGGLKCSTYKYVIVGSVIGGGAALVGVGGALWAAASGIDSGFSGIAQKTDEYESAKSSGQVFAGIGDGLFFLGAAVAIVGTILVFVWEPAPSASDVVSESKGLSLGVAPFHDGMAATATLRF